MIRFLVKRYIKDYRPKVGHWTSYEQHCEHPYGHGRSEYTGWFDTVGYVLRSI